MSSEDFKRITNYPNVNILLVSADTRYTTGGSTISTQYTTLDYYSTQDAIDREIIRIRSTGNISDTQTIYVSYTYNDYDNWIDTLIPKVERDLMCYLNNTFPDRNTYYASANIKVYDCTTNSFGDTSGQFEIQGFESGYDIYVSNTYRNEGLYTISSASSNVLKLTTASTVQGEKSTDEFGGNVIAVTRVKWPEGLKMLAAQIIWENMNNIKSRNIQSKSIGPSSITYMPLESGGYGNNIYNGLKKYKMARMK
jgi:hypothetical protein